MPEYKKSLWEMQLTTACSLRLGIFFWGGGVNVCASQAKIGRVYMITVEIGRILCHAAFNCLTSIIIWIILVAGKLRLV